MIRCVRGPDCAWSDGGGGAFGAVLCPPCADRVTTTIEWLPFDYYELTQIIARRNSPNDAKIMRPRPCSMPPIDLAVDAIRNRIVWVATTWEEIVREHTGLPVKPAAPVREGYDLQRAAQILAPRADHLAGIGDIESYTDGLGAGVVVRDGAYAIDQMIRLHKLARTILGVTVRVVRLPGECPRCSSWSLRRADGSDTVYCEACEHRWPYPQYAFHVRARLAASTNP